jgi:signal transduction histidine kinase/DNA-binding response OmpR family regulator
MPSDPRPLILNVDGDEMCRSGLTRILELHGFRVREASLGAEALCTARAEFPDLVLLDAGLPDMSGLEVCRILKSDPVTCRIPVLHIAAPSEPEALVATIDAMLHAHQAEGPERWPAHEWEATFDSIGDGIALVDAEGRIVRLNRSFPRLAPPPRGASATGLDTLWAYLPAVRGPFSKALQSRQREALEIEFASKLLDITVDPIFDEAGQATGAVCIAGDVTERRRLEEQFRESQKFETIGTLAAGVAHDFNNLLTGILGNASLILGELPPTSPFRDRLDDIVRSSQRAAELTRQLLAYSGKARHYMQRTELSSMVEGFRGLIESAVPKQVSLSVKLAAGLPPIEADASQVEQIILNLVSNAAEAIGDNAGEIHVETRMGKGGAAALEVRDTGTGMDAETKSRIFDPFFTTKFTGRGLGLAAVAGIVRAHKATIEVTSAPGQGSTFHVSFPAAQPVLVPQAVATQAGPSAGSITVLVVDDEEVVRRTAEATLQIRGYRVLLASDGQEAIDKVRRHPEIGVVLLDFTMPVMSGEEAIDGILEAHPELRVIVSTGYDHREAAARFSEKAVAAYLQKPYTSRQLAEKIASVL